MHETSQIPLKKKLERGRLRARWGYAKNGSPSWLQDFLFFLRVSSYLQDLKRKKGACAQNMANTSKDDAPDAPCAPRIAVFSGWRGVGGYPLLSKPPRRNVVDSSVFASFNLLHWKMQSLRANDSATNVVFPIRLKMQSP